MQNLSNRERKPVPFVSQYDIIRFKRPVITFYYVSLHAWVKEVEKNLAYKSSLNTDCACILQGRSLDVSQFDRQVLSCLYRVFPVKAPVSAKVILKSHSLACMSII